MQINYEVLSGFRETELFAKFNSKDVMANKKVEVIIDMEGKTRVSLGLQSGHTYMNCNFIPEGSEGLKFHPKATRSFADGNVFTSHLFVLSKKQNLAQLEHHIIRIVCHVFKLTAIDDFTIIIQVNCSAVRFIKANYPAIKYQIS